MWVKVKVGREILRYIVPKGFIAVDGMSLTVVDVFDDEGCFAADTRDGIRLIFQVEQNQEFQGLVCEGANVLPTKFIEDAFRDGYGTVVNVRRLDEVINSIDNWYMERGLFGMVSGVEILSGGIIKLKASEAEVNDISIRFLDKTGEPTVGKARPETILRQLTTKKGQFERNLPTFDGRPSP